MKHRGRREPPRVPGFRGWICEYNRIPSLVVSRDPFICSANVGEVPATCWRVSARCWRTFQQQQPTTLPSGAPHLEKEDVARIVTDSSGLLISGVKSSVAADMFRPHPPVPPGKDPLPSLWVCSRHSVISLCDHEKQTHCQEAYTLPSPVRQGRLGVLSDSPSGGGGGTAEGRDREGHIQDTDAHFGRQSPHGNFS